MEKLKNDWSEYVLLIWFLIDNCQYFQGVVDVNIIVVKRDGDVVAYHSCIADEFKDFLVDKLKFEAPSCSRHDYMKIYKKDDGKYYLKFALQFRFKLKK